MDKWADGCVLAMFVQFQILQRQIFWPGQNLEPVDMSQPVSDLRLRQIPVRPLQSCGTDRSGFRERYLSQEMFQSIPEAQDMFLPVPKPREMFLFLSEPTERWLTLFRSLPRHYSVHFQCVKKDFVVYFKHELVSELSEMLLFHIFLPQTLEIHVSAVVYICVRHRAVISAAILC